MRVTDTLRTGALTRNIETSLSTLNSIQQEISTGRKLNQPSDDPAGASQDLSIRESLVNDTQYQSDADAAHSFLTTSEGALSNVNAILDNVRQIAVAGANGGAQSPASLATLAGQVDGALQQITTLGNTDIHGKFVFAGTQTQLPAGTEPFALTGGATPSYSYQGNESAVTANIGPGNSLTLNSPGGNKSLFGDTIAALQTLRKDLASGDSHAVSADVTTIDARINATSAASAALGAKVNQVTSIKASLTRADTEYQTSLSNIENVDLAQAYVQLQGAQNVYQASLVTVKDAFKYSLADFLG